jgi:hypothetical protein
MASLLASIGFTLDCSSKQWHLSDLRHIPDSEERFPIRTLECSGAKLIGRKRLPWMWDLCHLITVGKALGWFQQCGEPAVRTY